MPTRPAADDDEMLSPNAEPTKPTTLSRRAWLKRTALGLTAAGAGMGLYAWQVEPRWLRVRPIEIAIAGLPTAFDGFRIAQLSDLHHSDVTPAERLRAAVAEVRELQPDLVALTGDYITHGRPWIDGVAEVLAELRADAGVYAVLGNHDHQEGASRFPERGVWELSVGDAVAAALGRAGVRVLRDEFDTLRVGGARLRLAGLGDRWARLRSGSQPTAFLRELTHSAEPTVLLAHNPDDVELFLSPTIERGPHRPDLMLSGHTHGGQVYVPGLGAPWVPVRRKDLVYGLHRFERMQLYINPGVGCLALQVRFAARPEITLLTLRSA